MLKNRQSKIILIFFILGIIILCGFGWYFINSLNVINVQIQSNQATEVRTIANQLNQLTEETKMALIVASIFLIMISRK